MLFFVGKGKKSYNSISVGAFLDDDDMSLEEVKNRQNAARNCSRAGASSEPTIGDLGSSQHHILSIGHAGSLIETAGVSERHPEIGAPASKNGCSSGEQDCLLPPVSNLMEEFEKLSCRNQTEADERSAGKPNQTPTISDGESVPVESTRQLRRSKEQLTCSPLPKASGKAEDARIRTEEKKPLEAGSSSAEADGWSEGTQQPCPAELQPEAAPQGLPRTLSSNKRPNQLFLLGYNMHCGFLFLVLHSRFF